MIIESKVDIDYGQLHQGRRELSISERQTERVGGSFEGPVACHHRLAVDPLSDRQGEAHPVVATTTVRV